MTPKLRKVFIVLLVLGVLLAIVSIGIAVYLISTDTFDIRNRAGDESRIWRVCPSAGQDCDFVGGDGIQQAVDAAKDGDTVFLKAGSYSRKDYTLFTYTGYQTGNTYYEKVMVALRNKVLTIEGEDGAILDGSDSSPMGGFAKQGDKRVIIKNLMLRGFKEVNDDNDCSSQDSPCSFGVPILTEADGGLDLVNCQFSQNDRGLYITGSGRTTIRSCLIEDNNYYGLIIRYAAQVDIEGCTISRNKTLGINIESEIQEQKVHISNSIIEGHPEEGINIEGADYVHLCNNTITKNCKDCGRTGGISIYRKGDVEIVNNIIANNGGEGIMRAIEAAKHTGSLTVKYNDVWNNIKDGKEKNYAGFEPGPGNISADPKFVSATDFHLQSTSPSINTGDPTIEDPDGSRSDMGAYGGSDVCNLDPNVYTCTGEKCMPACLGKECGDDGCGGSCGTCETGKTCNPEGICTTGVRSSTADLNGDGTVSLSDYSIFVKDYLDARAAAETPSLTGRSDLNGDGEVTLADYQLFVDEYLKNR